LPELCAAKLLPYLATSPAAVKERQRANLAKSLLAIRELLEHGNQTGVVVAARTFCSKPRKCTHRRQRSVKPPQLSRRPCPPTSRLRTEPGAVCPHGAPRQTRGLLLTPLWRKPGFDQMGSLREIDLNVRHLGRSMNGLPSGL